MKIRKARKGDLKIIDEIYVSGVIDEVKLQFPKRTKESIIKEMNKAKKERVKGFKQNISSKLTYFVVGEEKGEVVGFGQAELNKYDKKKAMIEKIYVKKSFRGKGIGTKIFNELLNWLKKRKVKSVSAGIFIKNKASIKLHKKLGFKETAVRLQKMLR